MLRALRLSKRAMNESECFVTVETQVRSLQDHLVLLYFAGKERRGLPMKKILERMRLLVKKEEE